MTSLTLRLAMWLFDVFDEAASFVEFHGNWLALATGTALWAWLLVLK